MNKVKVGFFSFTEITRPDEHGPYNEWHQLDHVPENIALPGIAHGQRWVCPPAYRDARSCSEPELDPIHYVTTYLMTDPLEQTLRDFLDLGGRMNAIGGRFHRFRKSYLAGPFRLVESYAAPRVLVHRDVTPYRPHTGIHVTVADVLDASQLDDVTHWVDAVHVPDALADPGVAGAMFYSSDLPGEKFGYALPPRRLIIVLYFDGDPLAATDRLRERPVIGGLGDHVRPLFSGPFQTITPWEWDWFDQG